MMPSFSDKVAEVSSAAEVSCAMAEKMIVHYESIKALESTPVLDYATFQGGSSIAYCHHGIRLSEDLDFACQSEIRQEEALAAVEALRERLESAYGLEARVSAKIPHPGQTVPVTRVNVSLDANPGRPDLPSIKTKIELARVPAWTKVAAQCHFPGITNMFSAPIVSCEDAEEIVADKVLAYMATASHQRTRDLLDIAFLQTSNRINRDRVLDLVDRKIVDYAPKNLGPSCQTSLAREVDDAHVALLQGMLFGDGTALASDPSRLLLALGGSLEFVRGCASALGLAKEASSSETKLERVLRDERDLPIADENPCAKRERRSR